MLTVRRTVFVAAAAGILLTGACRGGDDQANESANAANAAEQPTVPDLPIPIPEPPLAREQLLIAAIRAASDFSTGVDDRARQEELAGKKFEFRIRFGCGGPVKPAAEEPFGWSFDDKTAALKVRASPTLSTNDASVKTIAGEAFETVEGVWVRQPWLLAATCPRIDTSEKEAVAADGKAPQEAPAAGDSGEPQPPSVGIAQFFTATGPRTMRRSGRPYDATKRLESGRPPSGGFDFVLTGRLAPLPDGRVIACTSSTAGERPVCIVSVEFGKVWIERADTHEQIAQWGSG